MEDVMLPVAADFWILTLGEKDRSKLPEIPTNEAWAKEMLQLVKETVKFSDDQIARLNANKPIRDPEMFTAKINSWPNTADGKQLKKRFLSWFKEEERTELEKEAMFLMLHFLAISED